MSDPLTTWPALLASLRADPQSHPAAFRYYMTAAQGHGPEDIAFAPNLLRAAEALNRGTLLGQGAHMAKPVALLHALAQQVADADETEMRLRPQASHMVLAAAVLSDLSGQGHWGGLIDQALARLWTLAPANDDHSRMTLWASLAFGFGATAAQRLNLSAPPTASDAAQGTFDTPLKAQRQIARALRDGAPQELATKAWTAFLAACPAALARQTLGWNDLAWAARAYHVELGGMSAPDVPAHLLQEIEAL